RWAEQQVARRRASASAHHDQLRVERVHDRDDADSEPAPRLREHLHGELVAVVCKLGHETAGDLAPLRERTAEARVGRAAAGLLARAAERRARRERLEA